MLCSILVSLRIPFILALLVALFGVIGPAMAIDYGTFSFPPAHELFTPLQADPTEPHFGFSLGDPVAQRAIARVDVGDYLGIYRWALPGEGGALQLNVGGAIFTRFDATPAHSLQVIDYYGNVPLDFRRGRVSARMMFYHDSSHLGDDYLRENNIQSVDHSWEALRGIVSVQASKVFRLYGGYTTAIHTKPAWDGLRALQGGLEIYFNTFAHGFWHPYWANDVQSWQRTGWDPTWTSQIGFKAGESYSRGRGITYFLQFQHGPRYEGQFYTNRETIWSVGLKFELSEHLVIPTAAETPPPSLSASAAPATTTP